MHIYINTKVNDIPIVISTILLFSLDEIALCFTLHFASRNLRNLQPFLITRSVSAIKKNVYYYEWKICHCDLAFNSIKNNFAVFWGNIEHCNSFKACCLWWIFMFFCLPSLLWVILIISYAFALKSVFRVKYNWKVWNTLQLCRVGQSSTYILTIKKCF